MKRVLINKLASMGDLVMALPSLTDASKALPGLSFDWVVDRRFYEVPTWHPAVENVLITNHRSWRKAPFAALTRAEFRSFYIQLKESEYDCIVDMHGNFKTALLSLLARGRSAGFDGPSVPEWGSHLFYNKKCRVSKQIHSVEKNRDLMALSLGYTRPKSAPDYGLDLRLFSPLPLDLPPEYLVFVPMASYTSKLWPESNWIELAKICQQNDQSVVIPWGSNEEHQRALRIKNSLKNVKVLPKLNLSQIGTLLMQAKATVSIDTGLSHMAAALGSPCVTLYGPTDPNLTGTLGKRQFWLQPQRSCKKPCRKTCLIERDRPECLSSITPETVWDNLVQLFRSN